MHRIKEPESNTDKKLCSYSHFHSCLVMARKFKGESGLFLTCVNAMEWPRYCQSCMEVSYRTFGFGAISRLICRHIRYHVIHCATTNMRAWYSPHEKGNSCMLGGLRYEKIWRYNNSAKYVMARWLPLKISPLNFP